MKYVFFILLRATPAWLRLSREQRRAMNAEHLVPLLAGGEAIRMRYFDAEAFCADCSDLMMVETDDPKRHYFFMEHLRDSPMFTVPYFEVEKIIPCIEDGYVQFEQAEAGAMPG
jgi:hypothetical protein